MLFMLFKLLLVSDGDSAAVIIIFVGCGDMGADSYCKYRVVELVGVVGVGRDGVTGSDANAQLCRLSFNVGKADNERKLDVFLIVDVVLDGGGGGGCGDTVDVEVAVVFPADCRPSTDITNLF